MLQLTLVVDELDVAREERWVGNRLMAVSEPSVPLAIHDAFVRDVHARVIETSQQRRGGGLGGGCHRHERNATLPQRSAASPVPPNPGYT